MTVLSFVSTPRSASLQHLNPSSFRINIRKFCPTVIGCYYWNDIPLSVREKTTKKLFKRALYPVQLLSCSVLIIATPTLECYIGIYIHICGVKKRSCKKAAFLQIYIL